MALRWLILGAGGHGRSVADTVAANGDQVGGFLDDDQPFDTLVSGIPVLGELSLVWDLDRFLAGSDQAPPTKRLWPSAIQCSAKPGSRCLSRFPHTSAW
jgi:hypothetical protein